jgi:hypothetical protein
VAHLRIKFQSKAKFLRKISGSTDLETTMNKIVKTLGTGGIPSLIAGVMVVQEYGYARFTEDVDIIVPNVAKAREYLSIRGFKPNPGSNMTMTDRETKIEVDILPGGGFVGPGPLKLPLPTEVVLEPKMLSFEQLIATKLSSYMGNPVIRLKDLSDVTELLKANLPSRNLDLPSEVKEEYLSLWDRLKSSGIKLR